MRWRLGAGAAALGLLGLAPVLAVSPAAGDTYVPISGAGSTWSANALDQWIADVQQYGMQVNYAPTGSSDGRSEFLQGTVDYAASDIPFQSHPEDGSNPEVPAAGSYAYVPVTAGGTVFMYNLHINGQRVTNLRLSGQNVAKIFTGEISSWNDPAIAADNPQLTLPAETIVPVVRSDGSGSTAQFSLWMISQYPNIWNAYCKTSGRAPACGETSYYPTVTGMIAQSGDLGVAGYVSQGYADGAIGYVNYSYALNAKFPVAKMLNAAGYYTEPTPDNVAVSLLQAQVDTTDVNDPSKYLTQQLGNVYTDTDPRAYALSSYSYLIIPTTVKGQFTANKGKTLAAYLYYAMCQGQQESAGLGYSPMPYNLVQDSFTQVTKIPGAVVENINIQTCKNPTFSATSPNLLANEAPQPAACDKQGSTQCATGTAGDTNPTTLNGGSSGGGASGGGSSSSASGSTSSGGSTGGSTAASRAKSGAGSTGTSTGRAGTTAGRGAAVGGTTVGGRTTSGATGTSIASNGGTCDPSSGSCGSNALANQSAGALGNNSSGGGSASDAAAGPTALASTLPSKGGWGGTQVLILLVLALIVGLVVTPGLVARYAARRYE